jgi:eukaryotic-like serine/threonine-protein kinase
VDITVCGGGVQVPPVTGLTLQSAETSLKAAGFKYTVETTAGPSGTPPGSVWQQNPQGNTTEPLGYTVTLLVQPAAPPSPSPSPTPTSSPTATGGSPTAPPSDGTGGSPGTNLPTCLPIGCLPSG